MYVQFYQPTTHHLKTWILCSLNGGDLCVEAPEATREHIVEVKFFSQAEVVLEKRPIFPELICHDFREDYSQDFLEFRFLGIREMEFY